MSKNISFNDNSNDVLKQFSKSKLAGMQAICLQWLNNVTTIITAKNIVDTGRLRGSMTYQFNTAGKLKGGSFSIKGSTSSHYKDDGKSGNGSTLSPKASDGDILVGTVVEYADDVELGTNKMYARPFLKPSVLDYSEQYKKIFEQYMKNSEKG